MVKCQHSECIPPICASFGVRGGPAQFCRKHAEEGMIDVVNKKCERCDRRPSYNVPGEKPRFCKGCAEEGMVDVCSARCKHCDQKPLYGVPGGKPSVCAAHKTEGMIDVVTRRCEWEGCPRVPSFGLAGKRPRFCYKHKEAGMVSVVGKKCERCSKTPSFGIKGGERRFCGDHKEVGMINLVKPLCEYGDCPHKPTFGVPGGEPRFCFAHMDEATMIDVVNRSCDECDTSATWGIPGHPPTRCAKHRDRAKMVLKPTRRCSHANCRELAVMAQVGCMPDLCEAHAPADDETLVNVYARKCESCGLEGILDRNGHCETCDPELFRRAYLAKQNEVEEYLRANAAWLFELPYKIDRTVGGSKCGRERPDFIFDAGTYYIIIECDENQHRYLACECELTRMVNIAQSLGGAPVLFIRYNPDMYRVKGGTAGNVQRRARMKELVRVCRDAYNSWKPQGLTSVTYMYYDHDRGCPMGETEVLDEPFV